MPACARGQVCQSVQDGSQSVKWPGIRDQYPRDFVNPAGLRSDVNSVLCRTQIFTWIGFLIQYRFSFRTRSWSKLIWQKPAWAVSFITSEHDTRVLGSVGQPIERNFREFTCTESLTFSTGISRKRTPPVGKNKSLRHDKYQKFVG